MDEKCSHILEKYPTSVPIIIKKNNVNIRNKKFIVPKEIMLSEFITILRKKMELTEKEALYILFNNSLCPTAEYIERIYEQHADEDGYLYATITKENTFG